MDRKKFMIKNLYKSSKIQPFIVGGLIILISVLGIFTVVKAGTLTPPSGTPTAQFYTLSEIYEFIINNTTATEGGHSFTFADSLEGTGKTLTQIYDALAGLITADQVKLGTTYLNIAGALVPSGGDAVVGDVVSGKKFFGASQTNWNLKTGTFVSQEKTATSEGEEVTPDSGKWLSKVTVAITNLIASVIKKDEVVGGVTGTLAPDGSAIATDCLDTKTFYSDNSWTQKTGSILLGTNVSGAEGSKTFNIPNGYYASKTCTANDADLVIGNIKSGVNIFGIDGDNNVVDTTSGDAVLTEILFGKKCWVDGAEVTGNVTAGDNVSGGEGSVSFIIPNGLYSASKTCTANDADLVVGNIKKDVNIFGVIGTAPVVTGIGTGSPATASQILTSYYAWDATGAVIQGSLDPSTYYTWTKVGSALSWVGVNENLNWAKEIGGTTYWNTQEYSYCEGSVCTIGTLQPAASYTGPPGGWNGSNNFTSFNNSALQNYEVITSNGTNLPADPVDCIADAGDLVFPDGSVWDKSNVNAYAVKLTGCDSNDDNAAAIWAAAGGTGSQYAYARNAPSAVSIGDAWDGKKNLTTGVNGFHPYTNTGINDDYYDRPAVSWYLDSGDGVGTSRLPMIEEYEQGRQGTSASDVSLLYGSTNWAQYQWSAEQYPTNATLARNFYPSNGCAFYDSVGNQTYRLWVVVAQ